MNKQSIVKTNDFYEWIIIIIILAIILNTYGNQLLKQEQINAILKEKKQQNYAKVLTVITLIFIYTTEKLIPNGYERRLINSVMIFASTFCYLYFLEKQDKLTKKQIDTKTYL